MMEKSFKKTITLVIHLINDYSYYKINIKNVNYI